MPPPAVFRYFNYWHQLIHKYYFSSLFKTRVSSESWKASDRSPRYTARRWSWVSLSNWHSKYKLGVKSCTGNPCMIGWLIEQLCGPKLRHLRGSVRMSSPGSASYTIHSVVYTIHSSRYTILPAIHTIHACLHNGQSALKTLAWCSSILAFPVSFQRLYCVWVRYSPIR